MRREINFQALNFFRFQSIGEGFSEGSQGIIMKTSSCLCITLMLNSFKCNFFTETNVLENLKFIYDHT